MEKLLLIVLTLFIAGCSSTPKIKAEKPPKHMDRVEFVAYDSVARPMSPTIEVLEQPPTRKHKTIALITCEGAYHEEVVMTKAIVFKARQLGADAVVRLGAASARTGGGTIYGAHVGGRALYRANAIIFEKE